MYQGGITAVGLATLALSNLVKRAPYGWLVGMVITVAPKAVPAAPGQSLIGKGSPVPLAHVVGNLGESDPANS